MRWEHGDGRRETLVEYITDFELSDWLYSTNRGINIVIVNRLRHVTCYNLVFAKCICNGNWVILI